MRLRAGVDIDATDAERAAIEARRKFEGVEMQSEREDRCQLLRRRGRRVNMKRQAERMDHELSGSDCGV